MFPIGGARDKLLVVGSKAGALPSLDLQIEIAIEQVAELNVGEVKASPQRYGALASCFSAISR